MIPCRKNCAEYYEGCHKNCERWKEFLYQSSIERKEKKAYLDNYNQLCSTVVRPVSYTHLDVYKRQRLHDAFRVEPIVIRSVREWTHSPDKGLWEKELRDAGALFLIRIF